IRASSRTAKIRFRPNCRNTPATIAITIGIGTRLMHLRIHPLSPRTSISAPTTEDLAVRMARALEMTGKIINARATEVLPPPKQVEAPQVEPLDHSKPFAHNTKSRFRRL